MISIVYLLTSKWHDVDEATLIVVGIIDILIIIILVASIFGVNWLE